MIDTAPQETTMRPLALADVAHRYGLRLVGPDRDIVTVGPLNTASRHREAMLTFVTGERWLDAFTASAIGAAIVPAELAGRAGEGRSLLVADDPQATFYTLLADTAEEGRWELLESSVGEGTIIDPGATVAPGVVIGRDCHVMAGAVLLANTRLGDRVVIKPNATLGGEGFQVREIRGRRRIVPHTGGVDVRDDAMIGSSTCVDRGLFGDYTTIGEGTLVDNLVHVAHSVSIGREATVIACAELSGSVRIGDGAWIGPRVAINPSLTVGAYAFAGTGSVVVRDVTPHALVYGNPAKPGGWMCVCHTKLPLREPGDASCPECGRAWRLGDAGLVPA